MHFLVHTDAVVPRVSFVSNLRGDATLVERTRGQTSLAALQPVHHHSFPVVEVALL